jgi:hypothetical protein
MRTKKGAEPDASEMKSDTHSTSQCNCETEAGALIATAYPLESRTRFLIIGKIFPSLASPIANANTVDVQIVISAAEHKKNATNAGSHRTENEDATRTSLKLQCRRLLEEICSTGSYRRLEIYAEQRLHRLHLYTVSGGDLLNEAICSVLTGLDDSEQGRHPRKEDLDDLSAFENYLANVIKSVASSARRRENRRSNAQQGLERNLVNFSSGFASVIESPDRPDRHLENLDFQNEFFSQLKLRTSGRLKKLATRWQRESHSTDAIPLKGDHRQYRADLRRIARQVISEISEPRDRNRSTSDDPIADG